MRYQPLALLVVLLAMFAGVGCSPEDHYYSVSVKNDTDTPVTLIQTKDVPQTETMWASPEDLVAGRAVEMPDRKSGTVELPPHKTVTLPTVRSDVRDHSHAILRVYRGDRLLMKYLLNMHPV